jgi:hypothetical protein
VQHAFVSMGTDKQLKKKLAFVFLNSDGILLDNFIRS